jgi:hypothetical protein
MTFSGQMPFERPAFWDLQNPNSGIQTTVKSTFPHVGRITPQDIIGTIFKLHTQVINGQMSVTAFFKALTPDGGSKLFSPEGFMAYIEGMHAKIKSPAYISMVRTSIEFVSNEDFLTLTHWGHFFPIQDSV